MAQILPFLEFLPVIWKDFLVSYLIHTY